MVPDALSKTHFSGWRDPMIRARIETLRNSMDRHRNGDPHLRISDGPSLMAQDYTVWVPTDAVVSRTKSNWKTGISLIEACRRSTNVCGSRFIRSLEGRSGDV